MPVVVVMGTPHFQIMSSSQHSWNQSVMRAFPSAQTTVVHLGVISTDFRLYNQTDVM